MFGGKLDWRQLDSGELCIVQQVQAPDGDYRDWIAIRAWARAIAETLRPTRVDNG